MVADLRIPGLGEGDHCGHLRHDRHPRSCPLHPQGVGDTQSQGACQLANADLAREITAHKQTLRELEQARDELEQRVAERTKELGEATERFRSLFDHAPVAMLMTDKGGGLRQVEHGGRETVRLL